MKYSEVLSKRAVDAGARQEAIKTPEFQSAFSNWVNGGEGKAYLGKVSPGEIMRIALGATAGGGAGWLLSRLLHKKPKAWRTALYTLGGAAAGGFGTNWYLNRPGENGKTIAQQLRMDAAMQDPAVTRSINNLLKAKAQKPDDSLALKPETGDTKLKDVVPTQVQDVVNYYAGDNAQKLQGLTLQDITPQNVEEAAIVGGAGLFGGSIGGGVWKGVDAGADSARRFLTNLKYNNSASRLNKLISRYNEGAFNLDPSKNKMNFVKDPGGTYHIEYGPTLKTRLVNAYRNRQANKALHYGTDDSWMYSWWNKHNGKPIIIRNTGKDQSSRPFIYNPEVEASVNKTPWYLRGGKHKGRVAGSLFSMILAQMYNYKNRTQSEQQYQQAMDSATAPLK